MSALTILALAAGTFVGSHFLLSHPLRAPLVGRLGERGFTIAYALIAFVTLGATAHVYGAAGRETPAPLWTAGEAGWMAATLLMLLASIMLVGSLRRNPALPRPGRPISQIGEARDVFAITRHPMMWAFALWAASHAIVNATPASLILSGAIALLALGGAALQDRKKERLIGEVWRDWENRTSFVPFARGMRGLGAISLIGGSLLWLGATWAHGAMGYQPAGIFHFFG